MAAFRHGKVAELRVLNQVPGDSLVSENHVILLEEIARVFHETGVWPVWQFIDRFLDRADVVASDVIESAPDHLVRRTTWLRPQSEIRLTVAGLATTKAGASDAALFLDVLSWCVDREREMTLGPPHQAQPLVVTSDEYRRHCEDRGMPSDSVTMAKAYQLLSVEGHTGSGGFNLSAGEWSTEVDDRLRPFRGVTTLDGYHSVLATIRSPNRVALGAGAEAMGLPSASPAPDPARVFVVHGRNASARDAMFDFLRALGLRPIEWSQAVRLTGKGSPYIGEILDAAFAEAQAVIVLMTPDEIAYLRSEYASGDSDPEAQPATQSRPNVLFEAGMAMGHDSARAILVELGKVRAFSDVAGRHAVRLDDSVPRRKELAQRLETAGCVVDTTGDSWLSAGDFTPPPLPGGGLPLGKRVPAPASRSRVRLDLRYHDRSRGGRLEIINMGTEAVYDLDLEFPPDIEHFQVVSSDLPLPKLPPGKSAKLIAVKTMGRGRDHFEVRVTGRTAGGEPVVEQVFLSLLD